MDVRFIALLQVMLPPLSKSRSEWAVGSFYSFIVQLLPRRNKIRAMWRRRGGRGYRLHPDSCSMNLRRVVSLGITICRAFNAIREINFPRDVMNEGKNSSRNVLCNNWEGIIYYSLLKGEYISCLENCYIFLRKFENFNARNVWINLANERKYVFDNWSETSNDPRLPKVCDISLRCWNNQEDE